MSNVAEQLFKQAQKFIPGGVNSPVRAFKGVGGTPVFFKKAQGAFLFDSEDKQYIDYVGAWGPMLLGHQDYDVLQSIKAEIEKGIAFGAPTELETKIAELICNSVPSIDQVRMVNSGTEATMTAVRLARGYTDKKYIIKFNGCYHGHSDSLLVKAGSGALTLGQPSSPGVPEEIANLTITLEFNNTDQIHEAFAKYGNDIAGIIIEPVPGNMGCLLPNPSFLLALRQACDNYGALLIFDEVMSGFRVALAGAQSVYNIQPDLTTLGKIIGGGLPVGAIGGKKAIMEHLAPQGPVYQAGTMSGNPIAMAAGYATLEKLQNPQVYTKLAKTTETLALGIKEIAQSKKIPLQVNHLTGMFSIFFTDLPKVTTFNEVMKSDTEKFKRFYHDMLQQGIYFGPSAFESSFVSTVHTKSCIDKTLEAFDKSFAKL